MVGYPFSGKTVLAQELAKRLGYTRLSIDEVKFDFGFKDISDDDVPDDAWGKIFKELDRRIVANLKSGRTILNEYAWLTKSWRDRARNLATDLGIETKVIFVDTPVEVVRERWLQNKLTNERFDITESVFDEAIKDFEKPEHDENVIIYHTSMDVDNWIKEYLL